MLFGKSVNRYYFKYWYFFLMGAIALVVVDIAQMEIPNISGYIIDEITAKTLTYDYLVKNILNLAIIIVIMFFGRFFWRMNIFNCGHLIANDLRQRMFKKMEYLDQTYFNENKTGAQMALYTNDLMIVRQCFSQSIMMLVDAVFLGILAFAKMFMLNKVLALLAAAPLLLLAVLGILVSKYMRQKWEARQKAYSDLSDFAQENFSGFGVVKAFVKETKELIAFNRLNRNNQNKNLEHARLSVLVSIFVSLLISSIIILIGGVGAYLVYLTNTTDVYYMSLGDLNRYISYFSSLVWPMMALSNLITISAQGKASLQRIDTVLKRDSLVKDAPDVIKGANLEGKIEFKNLTFAYPGVDEPTIKDMSFVIEKGEAVGIIGRTGSGKSTIVDLLVRLYNVEEGSVFIDDFDIMKLPIKDVRELISFVPQDNFLFSDTILNNIAFSKDKLSLEEARKHAKVAGVDGDVMEFPEQYETVMGERGVTLSGGQKQRISISRALAKDSKVLILDDSVSAVDTKTEATILNNLKQMHGEKTLIIIAHRVSTIQNLDKIILVDDGKVVSIGKHDELYENVPMYRDIVDLQKLEDQEHEVIPC